MTKKTMRLNTGADEQWNMIRAKAKKDRNVETFPRVSWWYIPITEFNH